MSLTANAITPDATRSPEPPFRGLLRNGNPSGNPNAAPRCGAKNRASTPCQAPAMQNGRCRCHGGKSTGPRTPGGKARNATTHTTHGNTTATARIRHTYIRTLITRTRLACQARLLWPYLPQAMANRLAEGPDELWAPIHPSNLPFVQPRTPPPTPADRRRPRPGAPIRPLPRALAAERAAAQVEAASQAPWREAIAYARANKREWLAFRRTARTEKRAARAAKRAALAHAASLAANPEILLPPPKTPWADYTPLEKELAARLAGLRARTSAPHPHPFPAENPNSSIPRINPMNPEPTPTPTPNPNFARPRINPMNPEPGASPGTPATPQQHHQPPSLSLPSTHQDRPTDAPVAGRDPTPQNAPARTSPAAAPNPNFARSRINPMNPEPTSAPTPNPNFTRSRINPMNPEPTRPIPTKAQALATTILAQPWDANPHARRVSTRQLPQPPLAPRP